MEPEDVVHVLPRMLEPLIPDAIALDLQVIRPDPRVEVDGELVCELDGGPLFRLADAAVAAIDDLVAAGRLRDEEIDDHDVLKHYLSGSDIVDDWAPTERKLSDAAAALARTIDQPCVVRERCRLRRLRLL